MRHSMEKQRTCRQERIVVVSCLSFCHWFHLLLTSFLLHSMLILLPISLSPSSFPDLLSIPSPLTSCPMLVEAGMMKKMKEKITPKEKKEKKEKDDGCVPEIVAIKKTRIVPVAVPVRSPAQPSYESDDAPSYPPQPPPTSNKYSPPSPAPPAPPKASKSKYPMPMKGGSYGGMSEAGYGGMGGMGYGGEDGEEGGGYGGGDHEDDDEEEDGYAEHEDGYGVEGAAVEGYESEDGYDDGYKRRSSQQLDAVSAAAATDFTSLVDRKAGSKSQDGNFEPSDLFDDYREPDEDYVTESRTSQRFRRSLTHPGSRWRVSGSMFFMEQGIW